MCTNSHHFPSPLYPSPALPITLRSTLPQPRPLLLRQHSKLLFKPARPCSPLKELDQKPLRLVVALAPTTTRSIIGRKRHELLATKPAAEVHKRIRLVFPVAAVGRVFVGEVGGCGCGERRAGGGLQFYDEDFEDFEGRGDDGVLIGVCGGC